MANRKHKKNPEQNGALSESEAIKAAETAASEAYDAVQTDDAADAGAGAVQEAAESALAEASDAQDTEAGQEPEAAEAHTAAADPEDIDAMIDGMASELNLDDVETGLRSREEPESDAEQEPVSTIKERMSAGAAKWKERQKQAAAEETAEAAPAAAIEDDEYDPDEDYIFFRPRRRRKKRRRKKSRKLSCALVLLTLVLSTGVVLAVTILTVAMEIYGINKNVDEKVVTIPSGASTAAIAEQLQSEHLINIPQLFRLISRMNGYDGSYIAGEHVLSPSMSYQTMIEELCENHADEREYVTVTFREGITLLDAANLLEANEVCDADDFMFYFNAGGFGFAFENYLPEMNALKFYQREGYCFPDTYDFYIDEDPQIVAQKIYANFDSKLTPGDYAKMDELGMTLDEVVTLASIVQAEAADESQMRMIAGIFHNRLINRAVFDKLQSDPTRIYAETVIHENSPIKNELMEDAYNTYVGQGLPPGAINNPGKAAIEAVLYPEESNYYYFVANVDTRVTYYAATYEEHLANIEKIQQEQAAAAAAAEGE